MDKESAFLISQCTSVLIQALGMVAENQQRTHRGEVIAYPEDAFLKLIETSGVGHNAAILTLYPERRD